MQITQQTYVVYENWTAEHKAVIHKSSCGYANESHERITDQWLRSNHAPNDRWFGYFNRLNDAITFAAAMPNRTLRICKHCMLSLEMEE